MSNKLVRTMLAMILILIAMNLYIATAQPDGATFISNTTDIVAPEAGAEISTVGGSFTIMVLNVTQQNPRWKAYVGNVTGELVLADSNYNQIYDWALATITGEVYVSRSDNVSWTDIQCLTEPILLTEEAFMNIITTAADSINNTFNNTVHKSFWIGDTQISNSSCRAIATYVNGTKQVLSENATFQEILLDDTANMVYATILEQDEQAYDQSKTFDFQLIVADDEFTSNPTPYYFYAEIG